MNVNLRQFQQIAVNDLRVKTALALGNYNATHIPQVVSLQAPTGSGKTIIISALMEDIFFGTENYADQPEAIFVWLSDSPALNEQSKQKIIAKADKIRPGACVTVEDASFDQDEFSDGHIYFLNTQKIGKAGNLTMHSDGRQYTIWETIENTIRNKSDRLYFIIDEAHRGMQGREAGVATSIMQRFIKGDTRLNLSPAPVIIGMSATAARFNKLVEDTTSGINRVLVTAADVRASGLLKDRIIITYPDNPETHNDMSVLQAAADEWKNKSEHWYMYTSEQHYPNVYPIMVIQVKSGSGTELSDTNLDDVIAKIEERCGIRFKEGEVVHTFGSTGTISLNGLDVPRVNPEDINDDRRIRIVLFKENLSTGWDCPRAETMMSFRHAEDATYISQLLGRMVRTPLGNSVNVDDSLNDVRLFLPYFNRETVSAIVEELQSSEGEDIPTVVDSESMEAAVYTTWTSRPTHKKRISQLEGQMSLDDLVPANLSEEANSDPDSGDATQDGSSQSASADTARPSISEILGGYDPESKMETSLPTEPTVPAPQEPRPIIRNTIHIETSDPDEPDYIYQQMELTMSIDRESVVKYINDQALLSYVVRPTRTYSYLKSLLDLTSLLTITNICYQATDQVKSDVVEMIHDYVEGLKNGGTYKEKAENVLKFKLLIDVFDVFGNAIRDYVQTSMFDTADSDLDRQLRSAEAKLGGYGFCFAYGNKYMDEENPNGFKIDCILFAADADCIARLNEYAERKFNEFNDNYRRKCAALNERFLNQYRTIVRNSDKVTKNIFKIPEDIQAKEDAGGTLYYNHLFINDDTGAARIKLNSWEDAVIEEESKRPGFVCWLRNPAGSWGLCVPYEKDNDMKAAYPDFLIIRQDSDGEYVIDILEPHGSDWADNLGKAKGFAKYAEQEIRIGRFELIRMARDSAGRERPKRLDMGKGEIRRKVAAVINTDELTHVFEEDGYFLDI